MQINRKSNLYDIESLYDTLGTDPQLRLPISMSHGGGLGVDAALAQFVVTWARAYEHSVLHLYAPAEEAIAQIPQVAKTAAGLFALIMSSEIHTEDHLIVDRRDALLAIRTLVEAMFVGDIRNTSTTRGARPTAINLFCVNNAKR
ncbi:MULTISPECIES: hypothetical protein [Pseudomonas]|uniref:hypothetical protein n=1 Tax=Pseudomonas sp. MIACH TaxID=1078355 RepID=UPI000B25172B|nr:hypothetical protein [Pseudomonas sp. MIACH]